VRQAAQAPSRAGRPATETRRLSSVQFHRASICAQGAMSKIGRIPGPSRTARRRAGMHPASRGRGAAARESR
jgi:hypothetical protein